MRTSLYILLCVFTINTFGQVGINTSEPQAMLDVNTTEDGVLFPRLTQLQVEALSNPEEGLIVYNLDKHCLQIYDGIQWQCLEFKTPTTSSSIISSNISRTSTILDNTFTEASGLVHLEDGFFLMHNDSENILYKIAQSPPYEIVKRYQLPMSIRDWEGITISDEYVFIGDFGNNYAIAGVKKVYFFPINELRKEGNLVDIENVSSFMFSYPEQVDFNTNVNETDYDTEAFFYADGELHIFTKQWLSYGTDHYKITFSTGLAGTTVDAQLLENYNAQFLVTDASYKKSTGVYHLFLIGYNLNDYTLKFLQFTSSNKDSFFTNSASFSENMGSVLTYGKVEAMAVKTYSDNAKTICVASEKINRFITIPPKMTCSQYQ